MRSPRRTPLLAQEVRNLIGAARHLGEAQLGFGTVFVHDPECRLVVAKCVGIEVIERPVELVELRPAKIAVGGAVIFAMFEKELARD